MRYTKLTLWLLLLLQIPQWLFANQHNNLDSTLYNYYLEQVKKYAYKEIDSTIVYCDSLIYLAQKQNWYQKEMEAVLKKADFANYGLNINWAKEILNDAHRTFEKIKGKLKADCRKDYALQLNLHDAQYYKTIGFHKKAIDIFLNQLTELEKTKLDTNTLIIIYYNLGAIYEINGNLDLAFNYYFKGIHLQDDSKSKSVYIGNIYELKEDYKSAIKNYELAIQSQKELFQKSSKSTQKKIYPFIASSLQRLSQIYLKFGKKDKAISVLKEAGTYLSPNDPLYISTYYHLGMIYKEQQDYRKAIFYLKKTLPSRNKKNKQKNYSYAKYFRELANVYFEMGHTKKALDYYQKALINLLPDFNNKNYQVNPQLNEVELKKELIEVFSLKSNALLKLYLAENKTDKLANLAMTTAQKGIQLIDDLRKEYGADIDKQFLLAQSYQLFDIAIIMALELGQVEKALQFSERSKAMVLYQAVKSKEAERLASIDESLLERLYQIRHDLQTCRKHIRNASDEKKLNQLRNRKFDLNHQYELLIQELEKNSDFKNTKEELPKLSISDIKNKVLKANQGLVEYFVGKNHIYAFFIRPNSKQLQYQIIPWTDSLKKAAKEINYNISNNQNTAYLKNAGLLYQELLAKVFTKEIPQRLLLIPDDVLSFIPFNALLTAEVPSDKKEDFKDYPYLVNNTTLTQSFSIAIQWELQKQNNTASSSKIQMLAYAPKFRPLKNFKNTAVMRDRFSNLLHNEEEVDTVLNCFNGQAVFGEKANKKHFIKNAPFASMIHIASHAEVNRANPDLSYIAFSNLKDSSKTDFILNVDEIYNLRLKANMIVLSACETAVGDLVKGEGMISLARAFIYAGAKNIVTSVWKITDSSTCQLMSYFYINLKNKKDKDQALNKALKEYIFHAVDQQRGHPKYWAAFIIIGNTDPIDSGSDYKWLIAFGIILLLGVYIFIVRKKQTTHSKNTEH